MSLNIDRLEKVVRLANGGTQARCPACAETGGDRKGEHLRISPEGKFGCCVFPGDREHRKRIFALAGEHSPKEIKVRVAVAAGSAVRTGILGKLSMPVEPESRSDGSDGSSAVQTEFVEIRTARTGEMESGETVTEESRTARTGHSLLTRNADETDSICKLVEFDTPVRNVRETVRLPYLLSDGTLVIPFRSPERYHWWKKGGQSIHATKQEILHRKENDAAPF
jgi:hypothetical protein